VRGTEAGILYGDDSVARGFADRVGTFREALAEMTATISNPKFTKGGNTMSEATQAAATAPAIDIQAIEAEAREQGYAEADQEEIRSHVRPEASTAANPNLDENPVVKACAALAAGPKGAK
jgi:hypothetical protein